MLGKYKLVTGSVGEEFQNEINELIHAGWNLRGDTFPYGQYQHRFAQVLFREDTSPDLYRTMTPEEYAKQYHLLGHHRAEIDRSIEDEDESMEVNVYLKKDD